MKTFLLFSFLIAILTSHTSLYSKVLPGDKSFKKEINKSFQANQNTQLQISNKMGDIEFETWEKPELSIQVIITVSEESQEKADKIFSKIDIIIKNEGDNIICITEMNDKIRNGDFNIDYHIKAPSYIQIDFSNKFGNIILGEVKGKIKISVKYGSFEAYKISDNSKPYPEINLAYCNTSTIHEIKTAKLNIKYSKIKIGKGQDLFVSTKYSNIKIDNAESVIGDAGYDDYKISQVGNLIIQSKYTDIDVEKLIKKSDFDMVYGSINIERIQNQFDEINGLCKYNKVKIKVDKNISFYLDTEAKYAGITHPDGNLNIINNPMSKKVFGWIGKDNNSKSKIKVISEYGDIKIVQTE